MNSMDFLKALANLEDDLILAAHEPAARHRRNWSKALLIAAAITLTTVLVGCAVVYVLSMENLTVDTREVVRPVEDASLGSEQYETVTEQVLTFAGLKGTPAYQAAKEWYEFTQSYDPDHAISYAYSETPVEYPSEYSAYGIYSQEMQDKADELAAKYSLKLAGPQVKARSEQALLRYLGLENGVLKPTAEASAEVADCRYYENGVLYFLFHLNMPDGDGLWPYQILCTYTYNPGDCFTTDYCAINDTEDWQERNYTTAAGENLLILRSPSSSCGWIFCHRQDGTVAMMVEVVREVYEEAGGEAAVTKTPMTDAQLEQVLELINFSIQPEPGDESLLQGQPGVDPAQQRQTQNGFTLELKSAETDGQRMRIVLGVTAPEGVSLTKVTKEGYEDKSLNVRSGNNSRSSLSTNAQLNSSGSNFSAGLRDDGDGLDNTANWVMERWYSGPREDRNASVITPDQEWSLYIEDLVASFWNGETMQDETLWRAEGVWSFDISFQDCDFRFLECVQEPVTFSAVIGWDENGNDAYHDVTLTSFTLRSLGSSATFQDYSGELSDYKNDRHPTVVLKDGRQIRLVASKAEEPIPLDEVAHVLLVDGTKLTPVLPAQG